MLERFLTRRRVRHRCGLGLQIDAHGLTLVQLQAQDAGQWTCAAKTHIPFSSAADAEAVFTGLLPWHTYLSALLDHLKPNQGTIGVALPDAWVLRKRVQVPDGMTEAELERHLEAESLHYLGVRWSAIWADFEMLPASAGPNGASQPRTVVLHAVQKSRVQPLLEAVQQCGWHVRALEPAVHAKHRALAHAMPLRESVCAWVEMKNDAVCVLLAAADGTLVEHTEMLLTDTTFEPYFSGSHHWVDAIERAWQSLLALVGMPAAGALLLYGPHVQAQALSAALSQRLGLPVHAMTGHLSLPSEAEPDAAMSWAAWGMAMHPHLLCAR